MSKSTRKRRPGKVEKPRPDFPFFPHAAGYWAKKGRGRLHYFTLRSRSACVRIGMCWLMAWLACRAACACGWAASEIIRPDRRIDWSPGIAGGIPTYPVGINVKDAPYSARGDGVADDTAAIQEAINSCPAGKAVFLPAGTYRTTGELAINAKAIALRGAGPLKTRIKGDGTSGSIIMAGGSGGRDFTSVRGGFEKDSTRVTVSDAAGLNVGDYVEILEDNDPAVCERLYDYMLRAIGQTMQVVARNGLTLTLNRPLYYSYNSKAFGGVNKWDMFPLTRDVQGLRDDLAKNGYLDEKSFILKKFVTLHSASEMALADKYAAKKQQIFDFVSKHVGNVKLFKVYPIVGAGVEDLCVERGVSGGYDNITYSTAANCWIKNVGSYKTRKWHVRLRGCYACEVRESYFHDAWEAGGDADYGVGCFQRCTDNLIENNVFARCRHSMILEYGGCGNVYGYNYSRDPINENMDKTDFMMSDVALHGGHPYMNLFEGNVAAHIDCDSVLGSSRHNTYFRNLIERKSIPTVKYGMWGIEVQMGNLYENFVGNVIAPVPAYAPPTDAWRIGYDQLAPTAGDPRVAATILRQGNVDQTTGQTEWDGKTAERKLPASLYLKAKPAFFGDHPWPAIGPDVEPHASFLPAKDRYQRELSKATAK